MYDLFKTKKKKSAKKLHYVIIPLIIQITDDFIRCVSYFIMLKKEKKKKERKEKKEKKEYKSASTNFLYVFELINL